eukprot:14704172-Alexandrium_andersonii.AAC.1
MEADPCHAKMLAAMLGLTATSRSAPGTRGSRQAQSRLDEIGVAPQGPTGSSVVRGLLALWGRTSNSSRRMRPGCSGRAPPGHVT